MIVKELSLDNVKQKISVNKFINSINNVDVKQTLEWYELRHEKKLFLYLEDENGKIVSSCNSFELFDKKLNDKILYLPRGPIFDSTCIDFNLCIDYICKYAKEKDFKYIRLNPNIKKELSNYNGLKKLGYKINMVSKFDYNNQKESYQEAILKIYNISKEELLSTFHYKTRYNIRKSLRNNLDILISKKIDLENYYNLYLQTANKHNFNPHPFDYFQRLVKVFDKKIVFCTVSYKNKPLAISINIKQNNTLFYLYGANCNENKNLYASYGLHWAMINYAIDNNFDYYHFGGVFCEKNDIYNKDYGLLVFKSRFCTDGFTIYNPDTIIEL